MTADTDRLRGVSAALTACLVALVLSACQTNPSRSGSSAGSPPPVSQGGQSAPAGGASGGGPSAAGAPRGSAGTTSAEAPRQGAGQTAPRASQRAGAEGTGQPSAATGEPGDATGSASAVAGDAQTNATEPGQDTAARAAGGGGGIPEGDQGAGGGAGGGARGVASEPTGYGQAAAAAEQERVAALEREFERELGEFDGVIAREQAAVSSRENQRGLGGAGGYGSAGAAGGEGMAGPGGAGGGAGAGGYGGSALPPDWGEGDESYAGGSNSGGGNMPAGGAEREGDYTQTAAVAPIPDDIPDGRDDDIVARQLREAAMRETDPALREKLWDEYRKYKNGG